MPSTEGKLLKKSPALRYIEKFVTICHTDPGLHVKKEAKSFLGRS